MKSMDRGIEASNTLITYLFLFLVPAVAECIAVVILFFAQFSEYVLGVVVLSGVALYSFFTILITQWRKKVC
jgi:ABC-type transport system involved in Fe-S cluster assembly fused permease/ATPase subunit